MGCFKIVFKTIVFIGFFLKVGFGYGQTIIINEDFESGFGNWISGANALIVGSSPLNNTKSVQFINNIGNDNSFITTGVNLNLPTYTSVDFIFDYRAVGFRNNDGFNLQFSNDGGTTWVTIKYFEINLNFVNDNNYLSQKVKVDNLDYTFTATSQFRIQCDVKNNTELYLDNILIRQSDDYCETKPAGDDDDYISLVKFNTINNSAGDNKAGYSDFTNISTDVILNNTYDLDIEVHMDKKRTPKKYNLYAWFDWNQDGIFDDSERNDFAELTNISSGTVSKIIPIPDNAAIGNTRMRIMLIWNFKGIPNACTNFIGGEVEDYTINVVGITTGNISPTSYCAGSLISVPYTKKGAFNSSNIFTAQLSNASGSFASPVNIGTLTSNVAGTISATIPSGTPTGTGYRIRVVGSAPAVTGSNNGTNLTINSVPISPVIGTITQPTCTISTGSVVLNGLPSSGTWILTTNPGGLTTTGTGTITTISSLSTGIYNYTVTNISGCVSSASSNVVISSQPTTPTPPTIGAITQPTCTLSTGSVVLNGLPSAGTWTLTRSPGNVTTTGTGTSSTISSLSTGIYNYTVTNSLGCVSLASTNVVINDQPTSIIWTGAVSTDWNTAANWSCGSVPTITTNVLIPSSPTSGNYPEIYSGASVGLANDITIENGATVIVLSNSIEIAGTLLLNGLIDLEGEGQLIQNTGSILDPTSNGSIEIDQQGAASTYAYNYWGSPVGKIFIPNRNLYSSRLEDILYDGVNQVIFISGNNGALGPPISIANRWIYKYANKTGAYSEWQQIGSKSDIKAGEGFTMKGPNPSTSIPINNTQNYTFKGKPNNGTISLPVSPTNEYLVANPYPSAIDANQFINDNSPTGTASLFDGTLYFWVQFAVTNHVLADYQGGYATYNLSGGAPAAAYPGLGGGSSSKEPEQYIPVAQGFFTKSDADGGNIVFKNSQRVFETVSMGNSVFMKSSNTKSKASSVKNIDVRQKIRLGFEAPQIGHRQLLLTIDKNTTDGVDWGYEGKMNGMATDDMYWNLADDKYVIQALPDANIGREVPLGIVTKTGGLVSIKVDALENVDESVELYIKDALTGKTHQINTQPFEIALDAGTYVDRFSLTFSPQNVLGVEVDILKQGVHVFMNNTASEIQIRNTVQAELLSVKLFNSIGKLQNSWNKNLDNQNISLPINNKATGVYLVQINTTTGTISKKVVIE